MRAVSSPITPLEPSAGRRGAGDPVFGRQCVCNTACARIEAAVASSCGSQHVRNEDAHSLVDGPGRVFIVADGVGGGAMARSASRQLVCRLQRALGANRIDAHHVRRAVLDADLAIARHIAKLAVGPGAATMALCAPANLLASKWLVAWVGDCRVYRWVKEEGRLELLTRDDTFRHLDERPPLGGSPDDPARMVGNGATTGPNVVFTGMARGDLLVLCSDGVHKHVDAADWCRALDRPVDLAQRCDGLIALARRNGSADDATVMVLRHAGFAVGGLWRVGR